MNKVKALILFQMGYSFNGIIWRIDQHQTEHIGFPIGMFICCSIMLILVAMRERA